MDAVVNTTSRHLAIDPVPRASDILDRPPRQVEPVADSTLEPNTKNANLREMMARATTIAVVSVQITYVRAGESPSALDLMA